MFFCLFFAFKHYLLIERICKSFKKNKKLCHVSVKYSIFNGLYYLSQFNFPFLNPALILLFKSRILINQNNVIVNKCITMNNNNNISKNSKTLIMVIMKTNFSFFNILGRRNRYRRIKYDIKKEDLINQFFSKKKKKFVFQV